MNNTLKSKRCLGRNSNFRHCGRILQGKYFCDDHRFQPILLVIFLIFTVGTGILTYKDAIVSHFKELNPIAVSPAKINSPPMFTSQEKMRIENKGEDELFQIWIKFQVNDSKFDWNNLTLDLIDEPNQYLPVGSIKMSSYIYKLRGEHEGSDCIYLVLDRLETKKKYEFDVKLKNKLESKSLILTYNIISYSFEPNLKGNNKDGMGVLSFTPPEEFKLKSVSVILRK